eukprot:11676665-Ditylum_brightwellii.AAC.1
MDEACAKLKNELTSKPEVLDEVDRRIIQLEMERLSLQSDVENESVDDMGSLRLSNIDDELEKLKVKQEQLNARWMAERGAVEGVNEIQEKIAEVTLEIEKCEREFDLNRAAELKYSILPALQEKLGMTTGESDGVEIGGFARMLRDEVVADDIANVVAVWTGIPPQKMLESESDRILTMGDKLKERVIGQDEAIEVVTEAIQ